MSRTKRHKDQKLNHLGHDYGARYDCNKAYNQSFGVVGKDRADSERRNKGKDLVREELEYAKED